MSWWDRVKRWIGNVDVETAELSERKEHVYEDVIETTIDREVKLFHLDGTSVVIEFDKMSHDGTYRVVDDLGVYRNGRHNVSCSHTVVEIDPNSVSMGTPLGTYDVTVRKPVQVTENWNVVKNAFDLSLDISSGITIEEGVVLVTDEGEEVKSNMLSERDGEVVYREREYYSEDGPIEVEKHGSMGEIAEEQITGRSGQMRAVDADNHVIVTENDAGPDDVMQVQALPGGGA